MKQNNRVAMVTGAASGIGKAVAELLASHHYDLCLVDLNAEKLFALKEQLESAVNVIAFAGDLTQPSFVKTVVDEIEQHFGRLDFAFNNAGIASQPQLIADLDIDTWHKVMDVNINSVYYCMHYQIPLMLKNQAGSIVNTSSILGMVGNKGSAAYVASKHAVTGLSKAAALDYADANIRVNSVHPGFIETPLISHIDHATLIAKHPLGRLGTAEEVAALVYFLLSDQAQFITGAQYLIDGGYTTQ